MDKLHYKTLAAAVAKYGTAEGTEDEVKALIASDEKGFTPEQVEEIYQAILNPEKSGEKKTYIVLKEFRDKSDFTKKHYEGEDISHFDAKRLDHLVQIGYAKVL